jgi:YggT family protein
VGDPGLTALLGMSVLGNIVFTVAWLFLVFLIARFVFDYVFLFARDYTPTGVVLVVVEVIYTVTDPPIKLLRRFIPPLRLGPVALDLSVLVLFILTYVVIYIVAPLL